MKNTERWCLALGMLLTCAFLAGCGDDPKGEAPAKADSPELVITAEDTKTEPVSDTNPTTNDTGISIEEARERASKLVEDMSTEEKIGQVIIMEFRRWSDRAHDNEKDVEPLLVMNEEVGKIIADYHLGNLILFGENCEKAGDVAKLTCAMQHAAIDSGNLPLMIGIDQEGGSVARLQDGCVLTGSMAVGSTGDTAYATMTGQIIGSELKAIGVNCDFAPDLDVNSNRANPVIGLRSFSDNPQVVADMGGAMISALSEQGIIGCVKHFPGHGDTDTDSHTGLPLVERSKEEWLKMDGSPFAQLIGQGNLDMIMSAHIQYPGLDDTTVKSKADGKDIYLPATLSKKILTGILREELGYDGVIVTDSLGMGAITENFGREDAAVMALDAGADLLCMPVTLRYQGDVKDLESLYTEIGLALEDGRLAQERLDEAATRVLALKIQSGIMDADYGYDVSAAAANAENIVGGADNRKMEREIADAVVKLSYAGDFTAFSPEANQKIVVLMADQDHMYGAQYAFYRMEKEGVTGKLSVDYVYYADATEPTQEMKDALLQADYLILGTKQSAASVKDEKNSLNLFPKNVLSLDGLTKNVALICTGLPYQEEMYRDRYPCFLVYTNLGMSEADITADKFQFKYGPAIPAAVEKCFTMGK